MTSDMKPEKSAQPLSLLHLAGILLAAAGACAIILSVNGYYVFVLANVAVLALVGLGMNVLIGLSGQISFGHVGFYAIGAYTVAILAGSGVDFWIAWPAGALVAAATGAVLAMPALRVKGPYLAMVTIAFGFIVEHTIVEMRAITGGQNGIMGIPSPGLGELAQGERAVAIIAIGATAAAYVGYLFLSQGAWGAAMRAVRDSEPASESVGLNPLAIKTAAFAISAFCAGAAGGLFAPLSGFVTPHTFGFTQSILFVLVVMIGGAGLSIGPIIGALIVGILPELLSSLEDFRLLFFGGMLLVVLWVAPGGVAGLGRSLLALVRRTLSADGTDAPVAARHASPASAPLPARARSGLAVRDLGISFGGVHAVDGLTFDAAPGAVTSLIGPNGAGKTTALNMLSGFYSPNRGDFSLGEAKLGGAGALRASRAGVARTYQASQLFGSISVLDNVALAMTRGTLGPLLGGARINAPDVRKRALALLAFSGFGGDPSAPAADLPHVDRRLVEIARALAIDPDAILLDEPAAGLSSEDKQKLAALLRRIADAGLTVVLVEHDMTLVMSVSDSIVVLDAGRRLATGTPTEVRANPAVRNAYLGESAGDAGLKARAQRGRAATEEVLGVNGLVTGYGAEPVLHGVDVQVRRGEVVALLGANGAGKSTLMRTLAGLHRPVDAGGVTFDGQDVAWLGAEKIVALGMVLVPEGRQVFPELSVLDNIRLGAFLKPQDREARVEEMLTRFPRLRERLHQRAGLLSGGEQQMLALARALMSAPRILLLDEPSLGLAPKIVADLFASLDTLRAENMTILLVDQMAGLSLQLADYAYVIEGGRVVAQGDAASLQADDALARAYLGSAA